MLQFANRSGPDAAGPIQGTLVAILGQLPERFPSLVDWWAAFARLLTWFVAVVTLDHWLVVATGQNESSLVTNSAWKHLLRSFTKALVLDVPLSELLKEFDLIFFVVRPAHMKDVRNRFTSYNGFHESFSSMKRMATRKVVLRT